MGRFEDYLINEDRTALQEGLHCVAFGIGQVKKKKAITIADLTDSELFDDAHYNFCKVDSGMNALWQFSSANPDWGESVVRAVNAVRETNWLKGHGYTFYRGTGLMNQIYGQYLKLKKMEDIKLGNDKWNPSDIWAAKITTIPNFDTLTEYNAFISKMLRNGQLVGISLKKVGKNPKISWHGPSEKIEIVGYKVIRKPGKIFPTGMVIQTSKGPVIIQFRSFNVGKASDITGEIKTKGGKARYGKVPAIVKKDMEKKYNMPQMSKQKIKNIVASEGGTDELIRMVVDLWRQCGHNFSPKSVEKSWRTDKPNLENPVGYWQSILHSLEIGAFLNTHKSIADDIVYNYFIGASSITAVSSEFIKVS